MAQHQRCTDCGCTQLVEVEHELTCRGCGLVISDFKLVVTNPTEYSIMDVFREDSTLPQATLKDKEWAHLVCRILALPDNIAHSGISMFEECLAKRGMIAKGTHRNCLLTACVYYGQMDMQGGARPPKEVEEAVGLRHDQFSQACTEVATWLPQVRSFTISSCEAVMARHVRAMGIKDKEALAKVHKACKTISTRVSGAPSISGILVDTVAAAIIIIATKLVRRKYNMSVTQDKICSVCGVSTSAAANCLNEVEKLLMTRRL